jgi:hypothetical protein
MKEFRTKEGRFPLRLVYEVDEIDQICLDALRHSKCLPSEPSPVKVDLFLERHFDVNVIYEDAGPGIMGATVFNSKGAVTGIMIAPWIEDEGTAAAERRVRSTLAHEGGHALLHTRLFIAEQTGDLFGRQRTPEAEKSRFLCRNSDISASVGVMPKYGGEWWEWQANRAIGGLLLPRPLVQKLATHFLVDGKFGPVLHETSRSKLERTVAETFDVNPVVARIRLQEMFPTSKTQDL